MNWDKVLGPPDHRVSHLTNEMGQEVRLSVRRTAQRVTIRLTADSPSCSEHLMLTIDEAKLLRDHLNEILEGQ